MPVSGPARAAEAGRVAQQVVSHPRPAGADHAGIAISATGLVKDFGTTRALDGLDLTVPTGEVHGFLGPNGAGKTTTIRILLGLLRKTAGEVRLLGGDPWRDAADLHRRLAYVPGEVNLWPNLTGGEVIDLLGALRGGLDPSRRAELLERFELDPTKKCRAYSKGNRQKVALVAAFASDVELYLLDEPTSGLDPLMETVFQDVVRGLRGQGRTVLLSSHILSEVEALCDRVTIIRDGRAAESGTFDELRHLTRTTVAVETARPLDGLDRLAGVHDLTRDGGRAQFSVDPGELNGVLRHLVDLEVRSLTSSPPTLEELFLRHYGDVRPDRRGRRPAAHAPMSEFTGTVRLTRLALRRDRVTLPAWILGLAGFLAATTAMFVSSARRPRGRGPGGGAVDQQPRAADARADLRAERRRRHDGARLRHPRACWPALMSTFAVVRHTRQNEELGRAEMVGATVVGRYAGLTAAVVVATAANVVLAVLLGLAMVVNGQPAAGSFVAGASVAGVGVVFVGVAAVTSQLASTHPRRQRPGRRRARGVLPAQRHRQHARHARQRGAAGDQRLAGLAVPDRLGPADAAVRRRPLVAARAARRALRWAWSAVAGLLVARRDVGRGMWPERAGHATAGAGLLSPAGLAWRLQRGALLGWAVGLLGFGLIFGAVSEQIHDVHGTALEWYTRMGGSDRILDAFKASIIEMAGMAVAIYVVQILLRMRADEADGTVESVLSTAVDRPGWVLGHVVNAAAGAVVLMLVFAVGMGLTAGQVLGDTGTQLRELTTAALVQLPGTAAARRGRRRRRRAAAPLGRAGLLVADVRRAAARAAVRPVVPAAAVGAGPLAVHPRPEGAGGRRHRHPADRACRRLRGARRRRDGRDPAARPGAARLTG